MTFHVFGHGWTDEFASSLAAEDVVFEGFVPQVADAFDACRVAVAPLVTGAGIKGKVIDALAHGVPQVISPVAAEGTGVRDGLEVLVARDPVSYAQKVVRLCEEEALWRSVSDAAREFAGREFSFESGLRLMADALRSAGEPVRTVPGALVSDRALSPTAIEGCAR